MRGCCLRAWAQACTIKIGIRDGEFLADFLTPIDQLRDIDLRADGKLSAALEALVHTLGNHFPHPA